MRYMECHLEAFYWGHVGQQLSCLLAGTACLVALSELVHPCLEHFLLVLSFPFLIPRDTFPTLIAQIFSSSRLATFS